jgi:uncharacterized protein (TIGR00266 family)
MDIAIKYRPAHTLGVVRLAPGDALTAEAGAMVTMSTTVQCTTAARPGGRGGFLKSMKRMLASESFFTNTFSATGENAEVSVAPALCGDMVNHVLDGQRSLMIQGGSYVASDARVDLDTQWQGFKSFLSGESMFFLSARGHGAVLLSAFGGIETVDLDGELIVDTGHLVAFEEGIEYTISKAGSGWVQAYFSGEGFVLRMRGRGKLYLQTRNPSEYGSLIGSKLPAREA